MSPVLTRSLALICLLSGCLLQASPILAQVSPVTKEPLEFPREAVRAGVEKGEVKVKVIIDAAGNVTDVQILDAKPPRIFDRAVRAGMAKWKFSAGDANRSYETIVEFKR